MIRFCWTFAIVMALGVGFGISQWLTSSLIGVPPPITSTACCALALVVFFAFAWILSGADSSTPNEVKS